MSFKEWQAVTVIVGAVIIGIWVVSGADWDGPVSVVAWSLIWATGWAIVVNIVAAIVTAILVSIARREEFKDEPADERDRAVGAKSMGNAYFVASVGGLVVLFLLAFGVSPTVATYALWGVLMLAGVTDSASRLVHYRLG